MKNKLLNKLSLICNLSIIILVTYSISTFFTKGGEGNMEVLGFTCFRYFTVLSNVLVALTSLIYLIYNIKNIKKGIENIPYNITLIKLIGTVSVTVTFLTVLFFLGPTLGYIAMFKGVNMILHAIVPILAIISLTLLELNKEILKKDIKLGLLPTFLYSLIYITMVILIKDWEDFYGFTFGGKIYLAPLSLIVMYIATYIFSYILVKIHNKIYEKRSTK